MGSVTEVSTNRLFVFRDDIPRDERVAGLCAGLKDGAVYWLVSSRPSSLGGYLGNYSETYFHRGGYSPNGNIIKNVPTRYLRPID